MSHAPMTVASGVDPFQRIDVWMTEFNAIADDLVAVGVPPSAALALCQALQSINAIVLLLQPAPQSPVTLTA